MALDRISQRVVVEAVAAQGNAKCKLMAGCRRTLTGLRWGKRLDVGSGLIGETVKFLELKIPPPVVALLAGLVMWVISLKTPTLALPLVLRLGVSAALAVVGIYFDVAGLTAFRRAKTTLNPMKPDRASAVVRSGVFRITRNPMYLGLVFVLLGWAVYLESPWSLLGPMAFVAYIGRFQIMPEEKALEGHFGADYTAYKSGVRRWL